MKTCVSLALLLLVFSLTSCVTFVTKEITRSPADAKILAHSAILRPLHPPVGDLAATHTMGKINFQNAYTPLVGNKSVRKGFYGETAKASLVLVPGDFTISAWTGISGYVSKVDLGFDARQGVIYRVKATGGPQIPHHVWTVYEEDTQRVVFRKSVEAKYTPPVIYTTVIIPG